MAKCQKDPTYEIFMKRRLFKDINYDIPMSQNGNKKYKYTNTANDEVPERPKMWYIF